MGRVILDYKECRDCGEIKDLDEFYRYKTGSPTTFCKECAAQKSKNHHRNKRIPIKSFIYIISNPTWPNHLKVRGLPNW